MSVYLDQDPMMSVNPRSQSAIEHAKQLARQGLSEQAEQLCRDILSAQPVNTEALLLKGALELQSGRHSAAADSFRDAIALEPGSAIAHALLGDALVEWGQPQAALEAYGAGLSLDPLLVPALFGHANALLDLRRPAAAIAGYDELLGLQPENPEVWFNRGSALSALGEHAPAAASYSRAVEFDPRYAAAYNNRGSALMKLRLPEQALDSFDAAISIDPRFADALYNRGCVLAALRRFVDAIGSFDAVLQLQPNNGAALHQRGLCYRSIDRFADALASIEAALRLLPYDAAALRARGDILMDLAQPEAALQSFERSFELQPEAPGAPGALLHAQRRCAAWKERAGAGGGEICKAVAGGLRADAPYEFLSVTDDPRLQLKCAQLAAADWTPSTPPLWAETRYGHERIRLAYVSPDFRDHAVSRLLAGVFERHDRNRFEVTAISLRPHAQDAFGRRIEAAFDRFIDVSQRSDREVAGLLRAMEIDIAVDLGGFAEGCRPEIFAHRAVPLQVSYLGYPGTLGAQHMDYIVADEFVIPHTAAQHYSEQVIWLPACFQASDDRRAAPASPPTRSSVGLPDAAFVFCCFNEPFKIQAPMFDVWMRILDGVDGSVLWLLDDNRAAAENLRREAARRQVDPRRLVFAARLPYEQHLQRLELADLFLDTLPFNTGASVNDALWAGLPVLTCAGRSFAARMAGSVVRAAGLPEMVVYSLPSYEARALELARQPQQLAGLRIRLRQERGAPGLFNTERFARLLETAFASIWQRQQRGEAPQGLVVTA